MSHVVMLWMPGDEPYRRHPVDLDELTPKARALAEAIDDAEGRLPPGQIRIKSTAPARELYLERHAPMLSDPDEPMITVYHLWWQCWGRADEPSAREVLEWEARKIGWRWYPVAADGSDLPSSQAARDDDGVTRDQALEIVHDICPTVTISIDTWMRNATRGIKGYPGPCGHSGYHSLWSAAEVAAWAHRLRELADLRRQRAETEEAIRRKAVELSAAGLPDDLVARLAGTTRPTLRGWTGKAPS